MELACFAVVSIPQKLRAARLPRMTRLGIDQGIEREKSGSDISDAFVVRSHALGECPNRCRNSVENRPRCVNPLRKAIAVTVFIVGSVARSSRHAEAKRTSFRYSVIVR